MKVAVAFDHRGVVLRDAVLETIVLQATRLLDLGAVRRERRVDYPDKAQPGR